MNLKSFMPLMLAASACSLFSSSPAPAITQAAGSGKAATADQVPPGKGYSQTACVDLSDTVPCSGDYVVGCCDASTCAYFVLASGSIIAEFDCVSTGDCSGAAQELTEWCGPYDSDV